MDDGQRPVTIAHPEHFVNKENYEEMDITIDEVKATIKC